MTRILILAVAAVGVVSLVATGCSSPKNSTDGSGGPAGAQVVQVDPAKADELIRKGVRYIDVREVSEYVSGHIPGSELIPLSTVATATQDWTKTEPVLVICRSGNRSLQAARYLSAQGFTEVYNLEGGMQSWRGKTATGEEAGSY